MPRLYVANTSKLFHDFTFKLPGKSTFNMERVAPGSQICLSLETLDVVAEVIRQHAPYGIRDATKMSNVKDYVGICYSIEKPVPLDNLLYLFETNGQRLNDQAKEKREEVAVATAATIEDKMREMDITVTRTEVTMEEDTKGTQSINEGFEIAQPGVASKHGSARSRRAARRAGG